MKKAYFFTLDAFIAGTIIATGLLLVLFYRTNVPQQTQTINIADDVMGYFSKTKVSEVNNVYIDSHRKNKVVNPQNTLIEQLGEFYYLKDLPDAKGFTEEATKGSIPPQYGYMVLVNGTELYSNKIYTNATSFLFSSKKMIFGAVNQTDMWIYKSEVRVWKGLDANVAPAGSSINDCQSAANLGESGCASADGLGLIDRSSCCLKYTLCCPP